MSHEMPGSSPPVPPIGLNGVGQAGEYRPEAGVRFRDPRGREWHAREIDASLPGHSQQRCLIIESSEAVRRVWQYPNEWRALPLDALVALLDAR